MPGAADEQVVAVAALEPILAVPAVEPLGGDRADDPVAAVASQDLVEVDQQVSLAGLAVVVDAVAEGDEERCGAVGVRRV